MQGTGDGVFNIAQHSIDPFERWMLCAFAAIRRDDWHMNAAGFFDRVETGESVADNNASWCQMGFGIALNVGASKPGDGTQLDAPGFVRLCIGFDNRDKRCLVVGAAPWFAGTLTTDIGVVDPDAAAQHCTLLALQHQLVLDLPGRVVADPDFAHKLDLLVPGRHGHFVTASQIHYHFVLSSRDNCTRLSDAYLIFSLACKHTSKISAA